MVKIGWLVAVVYTGVGRLKGFSISHLPCYRIKVHKKKQSTNHDISENGF